MQIEVAPIQKKTIATKYNTIAGLKETDAARPRLQKDTHDILQCYKAQSASTKDDTKVLIKSRTGL
jgi:hypothetical protein